MTNSTELIARTQPEIILGDTLEKIMHEYTIDEILAALSDICYGEGTYYELKRADKITANKYNRLSIKLRKLKLSVRLLRAYFGRLGWDLNPRPTALRALSALQNFGNFNGGCGRTRTCDQRLMSPLLYH